MWGFDLYDSNMTMSFKDICMANDLMASLKSAGIGPPLFIALLGIGKTSSVRV